MDLILLASGMSSW